MANGSLATEQQPLFRILDRDRSAPASPHLRAPVPISLHLGWWCISPRWPANGSRQVCTHCRSSARGGTGPGTRKIAQYGYPHRIYNEYYGSRWAFFPGFPARSSGARLRSRAWSIPHAAVLDATVLGLTSAIAIWLAVREVFGSVIADRSVLLYAFFPAAYVLTMAYSEGLFLTAAAGCLFALSRRYWISAALLAVVASLTKDYGVLLVACVGVAAVPAFARERTPRPLVAALLAPTGFAAWLAFSWRETGTPLAFLQAERFWGNGHFTFFLTPVVARSAG